MREEIKQYIVNDSATLLQAMQRIDEVSEKILFVVNNDKFVATLTDGDIRRWIINSGDLNAPVSNVANYKPHFVKVNYESEAQRLLSHKGYDGIPVIDDAGQIVDILFRDSGRPYNAAERIDLPVVIMAGGKGTRLYPYTRILPKPLIPIGDIPITEHIIHSFQHYGCNDFYLILNHKKNMVKAYFNDLDKDYSLTYIDENTPLGTGGGVGLLKDIVHSTFILTNCDTLIDESFYKIAKAHMTSKNDVTMICSLKNYNIPYGVVEIGAGGEVTQLREKPHMSFFTNTGTYIVNPSVIELIEPDEYVGFPDVVMKAKDIGMRVGVYPVGEKQWMDMGQLDELDRMKELMKIDE